MRTFKSFFSDERGIALPVALAVLFVVAGLATVAARSAIVAGHQSFRDRNAKSAIQAAQSGLQAAIYELNMIQPGASSCVAKDASGNVTGTGTITGGWCTNPETETLGDGASYSVLVSQGNLVSGTNLERRTIVATGSANGVKRRATTTIDAATGDSLFPTNYAMVARDSVQFKNNASFSGGGVGSNNDITFKNNTDVCGAVTYGGSLNLGQNFSQCSGAPAPAKATQPFQFQPVDMSGPNASNQNAYITRAINNGAAPKDSCSNCNKISWSESTRVLNLTGNSVLTLTGDVYSFCSLTIGSNAQLQIAARPQPGHPTPLFVYIDTPENCGDGMGSATLTGQVVNVNSNPATFVMMVAGSPTIATTVGIDDNAITASNAPMAIYAPNSTVDFKNNLDWKGALMAKTITIKNNADITYDTRIGDIVIPNSTRFFESHGYKECASDPSTAAPDSAC